MKSKYVQYYVEGTDEEKLVNVLKTTMRLIKPGKIQKLNVVEQTITNARLRTLKPATMVVLIFDTDTGHIDILNNNIKILKKCSFISEIVTIPQVPNLEGELIRSCNIKKITELLNSKSKSEYKSDIIRVNNLDKKLIEHEFDIESFWNTKPKVPYDHVPNDADKIKLVLK